MLPETIHMKCQALFSKRNEKLIKNHLVILNVDTQANLDVTKILHFCCFGWGFITRQPFFCCRLYFDILSVKSIKISVLIL